MTTQTTYYADESMFHGFIPHCMGTRFDLLLIYSDRSAVNALWAEVAGELERLDRMLNRFDPASEIARINATAGETSVRVSDEMGAILWLCLDYYDATEHLFDVTLKDFSRVEITDAHRVRFGDSRLSLDLGGFAKGYALKKIEVLLRSAGIDSAFVDFGNSSILGLGRHPYGACWKVVLPDPVTQQPLAEFDLENLALSTSGNTAAHTRHIVDPQTGIYDDQRKLAAVTSSDPLDAEVLSTVRMIADEDQWARIALNFKNMQGTLYPF